MFRLHDRTRRRVCLGLFFGLGVLPTVLVVAWSGWRHTPAHVEAEAKRLGRQFGLPVVIERLVHPRPGVVRYEGLEVSDPETGRALLRCPTLTADWTTTNPDRHSDGDAAQRPPTLTLRAVEAELDQGMAHLGRLLGQVLEQRMGSADLLVRFTADELTIRVAEGCYTLSGVQGGVETLVGGSQAVLRFGVVGVDMAEPAAVRIVRNRQATPATTGFEIHTAGAALPCGLLAAALPVLRPLGPRARFQGYLWASQPLTGAASDGWDGEVTGQLLDVELGRLVTEHFPHEIGGTGTVTVQMARFHHGRIETASGMLDAGPGTIGRSLVDAAVQQLELVRGPQLTPYGLTIPYERLSLAFMLDAEGLRLEGRSAEAGDGTLLVDQGRRLLAEPQNQPQPVVALLRTLVPLDSAQAPATRQTDWLMRRLPLPQVTPAAQARRPADDDPK